MAQRLWRVAGQRENLFPEIDGMLERIRRERGGGSDFLQFKAGTGGLIEAEFLVQALQMRAGIWKQNWSDALAELVRQGALSRPEGASLKNAYAFLRRCESVLRRREDKSISTLAPADELEQCKLARWLDCETLLNSFFRRLFLAPVKRFTAIYFLRKLVPGK